MIQMKNTSIMKTADDLRIEREKYLKSIDDKRLQEAEEWLISNSEKIEKQIVENGFCDGLIQLLGKSVFGVTHSSGQCHYEFGAISIPTFDLVRRKLEALGYKVSYETHRSDSVFTLKISLPSKLARDAVRF